MAFPAAAGYGNLPNGNFSPVIYSKKAQLAFRRSSVIQAITNTDYQGEIADYGDTVKIMLEPDVTVKPYKRGVQVTAQDLVDEDFTMTIDQANYFMFKVDDLEKKQSHINFESMAADRAGYRLKNAMDREVISHIESNATNVLGTSGTPITISTTSGVTANFTPVALFNRLQRLLDEEDVPEDNRWFLADPVFYEVLGDEDSKLINRDYADSNILRNGKVSDGMVRGFELYKSNNMQSAGTGPLGTGSGNFGWILAGHKSAVSTAEQINRTESFRDHDSFADVVRGMHYYGRKILRQESLIAVRYQWKTS